MPPNKSLQQTLAPVAPLAIAKPAPASIAAEPRRYAAPDTWQSHSGHVYL